MTQFVSGNTRQLRFTLIFKSVPVSPSDVDDNDVVGEEDGDVADQEAGAGDVEEGLLAPDLLHHVAGKDAAEEATETQNSG